MKRQGFQTVQATPETGKVFHFDQRKEGWFPEIQMGGQKNDGKILLLTFIFSSSECLQSKYTSNERHLTMQNTTAVSYIPKRGRNVLLLSSKHRDPAVTEEEKRKPMIIADYNHCKGAVDNLDKSKKNARELEEAAAELKIGQVFTIRWVSSSYNTVKAVLKDFPVLAHH
ncbi:hypothetical protein JOQ06_025227 [Pogonophryne albipinna]|uniref:Uncharacterized protein n=1 Tax=Pogonophryne albipinna TaxID=1090488 RepID=A0AAD6AT97_9TELE|nr:hypothetical protein JOQ06_025227 [Pogonophryne albipinna]